MIKILIADDHAVVRQGLTQILAQIPEVIVAGESTTGDQTLKKMRSEPFDLVIMDISMPGRSGLELLRSVKEEFSQVPVLVLSMHPEDQYAVRMHKAGASGYLTKESAPDELVKAVRKIMSGGRYVSPTLAEILASQMQTSFDHPTHENLSDREFQVMQMIAQGRTVKEIGEELALSVKTISTYRARALEKLDLHTNAQLIHYAIQNGLVE
jgi:DNA-binding NarL/FixJ family response regulator